jgi:hypothetical protein
MPSIRIQIPPELEEEINSQSIQHGLSRQSIIKKHYSLVPSISTNNQSLEVYTAEYIARGFDAIMKRKYLKFRLEEAGLRYQKLLREHEELKATFEITIKKIKTPWWIRLRFWKKKSGGR